MTVRELIHHLLDVDLELEVFYPGGSDPRANLRVLEVDDDARAYGHAGWHRRRVVVLR